MKFILDSKHLPVEELLEWKNELGNTPLWLSCSKKFPCIIEELLQRGADPNSTNLKKNPPLSAVCQRGNAKICQLLLTYGAKVEFVNENGDTSLILCCRNNQVEVLKLLLPYASSAFISYKAAIDGFDVVLAATEVDHSDCIQALADAKVNLHVLTDIRKRHLTSCHTSASGCVLQSSVCCQKID